MSFARNIAVIASFIIVSTAFIGTAFSTNSASGSTGTFINDATFSEQISDKNAVSVAVKPISMMAPNEPIKFEISINTHQVPLNFNIAEITVLADNNGNTYAPLKWDGSPPGGHHRRGILTFPALIDGASQLRLVIKGVAGVPEREFVWNLD